MSQQAQKKRGAGKDPEFMRAMREKAALVVKQNKAIRDAEKLKMKKEREQKVKEAQDYLNPPPVQEVKREPEPEPEPASDHEPEVTKPAPRKRAPRASVEQDEPDYKQEYYKQKLELLKNQKLQQEAQATKETPPQAHPYELARHDIHQHVNKAVMDNMWRQYFPDHASPYS